MVKEALNSWYHVVSQSRWEHAAELTSDFPTARPLGGPEDRVVFKIQGNSYRLIAGVNYRFKIVFCKFFGTHAEYDNIDALTVSEH